MSEGEKMVWAAAYVAELRSQLDNQAPDYITASKAALTVAATTVGLVRGTTAIGDAERMRREIVGT